MGQGVVAVVSPKASAAIAPAPLAAIADDREIGNVDVP